MEVKRTDVRKKGGKSKSRATGHRKDPTVAAHGLDHQLLDSQGFSAWPFGSSSFWTETQSSPESNGFPICLEERTLEVTFSRSRMRHGMSAERTNER